MTSCCFTGHRFKGDVPELELTAIAAIEKLIADGVTDFYCGGAYGFDILCGMCVLKLREKYPDIKLHMVLPCPPEMQCSRWLESDKLRYRQLVDNADTVEIAGEHNSADCMKVRNTRLVKLSEVCLCYFRPTRTRSGTVQTIRMAQNKQIDIINLYR